MYKDICVRMHHKMLITFIFDLNKRNVQNIFQLEK
jgi:hypothetical protein